MRGKVDTRMRMRLPRTPSAKWWVTLLVTVAVPSVVGILTTKEWFVAAILVTAVAVLGLGWFTRPTQYDQAALEGMLLTLCDILALPGDADVRYALYAVEGSTGEEQLVAVTNYMPEGDPLAGRTLSRSQGIVGRAFRAGETRALFLDDDIRARDFREMMREDFGFSKHEAKKLQQDRRGYLAVPVLDPSRRGSGNIVAGVIYLDANRADAFADPGAVVWLETVAPVFHRLLRLKGE